MSKQDILNKIKQAGVIGAGGAGFPTYKKLESRVDHIIANGAECEPLLTKDRESILREPEALVNGLSIMQDLTGAKKITIALKEKNKDLKKKIQSIKAAEKFEFLIYPNVYPAGDEYLLVYEITGKRIPPGGIPLQVGCVVDNNETIINLYHAVNGKPVTEKYLTVTGAVDNAITMRVPVGTSFRKCIEIAGGLTTEDPVILTGGVMMGGVETDLDLPVTKTLGGLIVIPGDHYLAKRKMQKSDTYQRIGHGQCDQCSLCTELCPRYTMGYPIEPHRVMRTLLMTGEKKMHGSLWAQYCCECNICSYIACPESLDPKNICVDAKSVLREGQLSRTEAELQVLFRDIHPARRGREIPISTLYQRLGIKKFDRHPGYIMKQINPPEVLIPLNSHIGQPAKAVVKTGEKVSKKQIIGSVKENELGAAVHASIDGTVYKVTPSEIHIKSKK